MLVNGHLLDQVLRKSGIPRIVHKELRTILRRNVAGIHRKRTSYLPCNDSIVQGSAEKQKDEESCLYISPLIKIQLIRCIALFFLSISSVSTEQWQPYARNLKTIKIERGNL